MKYRQDFLAGNSEQPENHRLLCGRDTSRAVILFARICHERESRKESRPGNCTNRNRRITGDRLFVSASVLLRPRRGNRSFREQIMECEAGSGAFEYGVSLGTPCACPCIHMRQRKTVGRKRRSRADRIKTILSALYYDLHQCRRAVMRCRTALSANGFACRQTEG